MRWIRDKNDEKLKMMAKYSWLAALIFLTFGGISPSFGQKIEKSFPAKMSNKYTDYEIIGKNQQGIFLHFYGNTEHQLEMYNDNLRSMQKKVLNLRDKNSQLEEIMLLETGLLAFYSHISEGKQYLKVRYINDYLETSMSSVVLDSITKFSYEGFDPFYVKQSNDLKKLASFTIFDEKGIFSVHFKVYNDSLTLLHEGKFEIEKRDMVLKSFKINNNGAVFAVLAKIGKGSDMHDYTYDELYSYFYDPDTKSITRQDIVTENYRFKQVISEISNTTNRAYVSACYKNRNNSDDLGLLVTGTQEGNNKSFLQKIPLTKELVGQMQSYDFKDWIERAVIIRPKDIIPRSDGGCIVITEGQYQYTRVVRTPPTNMYFYGESFTRMFDQNHYFDIMALSLEAEGDANWVTILPKVQVTEGDGGIFSSYVLYEANNLLKFLFNEDIYNNGNFIEYNLNPAGAQKRVSLFNSDKEGITLIPQKGKQISGNQLLIPSEQKRNLQLVMFNF